LLESRSERVGVLILGPGCKSEYKVEFEHIGELDVSKALI
ncbi:unnamed protein product, partial [Heterotrigona itama]